MRLSSRDHITLLYLFSLTGGGNCHRSFPPVANQPLGVVEAQFASTFFTIGSRLVFTVSIEVDINVSASALSDSAPSYSKANLEADLGGNGVRSCSVK